MRLLKHLNEARGETTLLEIVQTLFDNCRPYLKEMSKTGVAHMLFSGRKDSKDVLYRPVRKNRYSMDTPQELSEDLDGRFKRKFGWKPRTGGIFCTGDYKVASDYGVPYSIFPIGKFRFIWSPHIKDMWTHLDGSELVGFYQGEDVEPDEYSKQNYYDEAYRDAEEEYANRHDEPEESDFEDDDGEVDDDAFQDAYDDWRNEKESYAEEQAERYTSAWIDEYRNEAESRIDSDMDSLISDYTNKDLKAAIHSKNEIMLDAKEIIGINYAVYKPYLEEFIKYFPWRVRPTKEHMQAFIAKYNYKVTTNTKMFKDVL